MKGLLCLTIVLSLRYEATSSAEVCPRLEFVNFTGNSLRAVENEFINITFFVSWENCSRSDLYLVKVSRLGENNLIMDLCKIIYNNSRYDPSQSSNSCRIVSSDNNIEFSEQVKSSDTTFMFSLSVGDLSKRIDLNISIWKDSSNSSTETDTTATPTTTTTTEQQTSTTTNKPDDGSIHTKDLWISLFVSIFILVIALIIFLSVYWMTSRAQRSVVDSSKVSFNCRQFVRMSSDVSGSWNYCKWRRILRTEGGLWEFSRLHQLLGIRGDYSNVADDLESPTVTGRVGDDGFYETLDSEAEVRNDLPKISASGDLPRSLDDNTQQKESSTDCSPDKLYWKTNDLYCPEGQVTRSDDYNHLGEILERKESQTDPDTDLDDYISIRKIRERKEALKGSTSDPVTGPDEYISVGKIRKRKEAQKELTSAPVTATDDYISIRKIRERKEARKAAAADNSGDDYVPITDICERKRKAKGDSLDNAYVSISDIKSRKKMKRADADKRLRETGRTGVSKDQVAEDPVDDTDVSPDDSATCRTSTDEASKRVSIVLLDTNGQCVTVDFSTESLQRRL